MYRKFANWMAEWLSKYLSSDSFNMQLYYTNATTRYLLYTNVH